MRRYAILYITIFAGTLAFAQQKAATPAAGAAAPAAAPAAAAPVPTGPHPKSAAESQALITVMQTPDPDGQIKAAEALLTGFPDTDYKAVVLFVEADAWQRKGDNAKAIDFGEKAIATDAKNFDALLLLANTYAQTTKNTDLDMDEKLSKADKYANDAIAVLTTMAKPNPQLADADWEATKKEDESQAYQALGSSNVVRKRYEAAIADFQKGLDLFPDPLIMLRAGRAELAATNYDKAIVWFDKAAAAPGASDQVKRIAASDKGRAEAAKKTQ